MERVGIEEEWQILQLKLSDEYLGIPYTVLSTVYTFKTLHNKKL